VQETGEDVTGIFLETAHPAKFKEVVEDTLGRNIEIPPALQKFMQGKKKTISATTEFAAFKDFLLKKF
jgi:threonine synthase